jgi:hypothetical protein
MMGKSTKKVVKKATVKKTTAPKEKSFLSNFTNKQIDDILKVVCMTEKELSAVRGTELYDLTVKAFRMVRNPNDFCELFGNIGVQYTGHIGYDARHRPLAVKTIEMSMFMVEIGRPMVERSHGYIAGVSPDVRDKIFYRANSYARSGQFRDICSQYYVEVKYLFDLGFLDAKARKVFDAPVSKSSGKLRWDTKSVLPSWFRHDEEKKVVL